MNEPILKENDSELTRVLSNPDNFLMSDGLVDRLNLDMQEVLDINLESSIVALLEIDDTKLVCPLLSYSRTGKYHEISFLISEEKVLHLFNLKDNLNFKLVTKNATILKELTMVPSNEIEMFFGQEGYVKVKVRL